MSYRYVENNEAPKTELCRTPLWSHIPLKHSLSYISLPPNIQIIIKTKTKLYNKLRL